MIDPLIISAIANSLIMGLVALGFTLQYVTLRVPNLAHTTICFSSAYITLTFWLLGYNPYFGVFIGFLESSILTYLLYNFLNMLKARGLDDVSLMISTIGISMIIYGFANIYLDYLAYVFKTYTRTFTLANADFKLLGIPGVIYISLILFVFFLLFFNWLLSTKFGIQLRAIVEKPSLAEVHGVDVKRVVGIAWFIIGGIGGIAGSLWPLWFQCDPWLGPLMLTSIFAACALGGIKSILGSLFGGIFIGVSQVILLSVLSDLVGTWIISFKTLIPLIIASLVLLFLPEGIMGKIQKYRGG